jgi:AcrR family transcriptional regulator
MGMSSQSSPGRRSPDDTRERILAATYACVARAGLARTTVDDVAREVGLSRATIYRWFPGGREELVRETVDWEVDRFLHRLADAVADSRDFATLVERGLVFAHQAVDHHDVLQKLLANEPERLVPNLFASRLLLRSIREFLMPMLREERLRPGVDAAWAADEVARLVVSYIGTPGVWDFDDPVQVHRLVQRQFLAPIVRTGP